jgi:hypothetical protein
MLRTTYSSLYTTFLEVGCFSSYHGAVKVPNGLLLVGLGRDHALRRVFDDVPAEVAVDEKAAVGVKRAKKVTTARTAKETLNVVMFDFR